MNKELLKELVGYGKQMQREESAEAAKKATQCLRNAKFTVGMRLALAAGFEVTKQGQFEFESEAGQFTAAFVGDKRQKGISINAGWAAGREARISAVHLVEIQRVTQEFIEALQKPSIKSIRES